MDLGNGRLFKETWYGGYNTRFIAVHVQLIKVHHQTNMYSHICTLTLKIFCLILRKGKKKNLWQIDKKNSSLSLFCYLFFFFFLACKKKSIIHDASSPRKPKKKKTVNPNFKCLNHISLPLLVHKCQQSVMYKKCTLWYKYVTVSYDPISIGLFIC